MRILIILVLVLVLYYLLKALFQPRIGKESPSRAHPDVGRETDNELVKDLYCQTYIPVNTAFRAKREGKDLFFCSRECMNRYLQEKEGDSFEAG